MGGQLLGKWKKGAGPGGGGASADDGGMSGPGLADSGMRTSASRSPGGIAPARVRVADPHAQESADHEVVDSKFQWNSLWTRAFHSNWRICWSQSL